MYSPLETELLVQAQIEEIRRLAHRGDSAHRFFLGRRKHARRQPEGRQSFRQAWEDPALVKMQMAGEASSLQR